LDDLFLGNVFPATIGPNVEFYGIVFQIIHLNTRERFQTQP
tara:strand:- start:2401 stop:2523 length:123 start_codon:yes stop_codon:yes gene_type:complete